MELSCNLIHKVNKCKHTHTHMSIYVHTWEYVSARTRMFGCERVCVYRTLYLLWHKFSSKWKLGNVCFVVVITDMTVMSHSPTNCQSINLIATMAFDLYTHTRMYALLLRSVAHCRHCHCDRKWCVRLLFSFNEIPLNSIHVFVVLISEQEWLQSFCSLLLLCLLYACTVNRFKLCQLWFIKTNIGCKRNYDKSVNSDIRVSNPLTTQWRT